MQAMNRNKAAGKKGPAEVTESNAIPRLSLVKRRLYRGSTSLARNLRKRDATQTRGEAVSRRITMVESLSPCERDDGVRNDGGRFSGFLKRGSIGDGTEQRNMPMGSTGRQLLGARGGSPLLDARKTRKTGRFITTESDGIGHEEVFEVRMRYKKMLASVEAAGGKLELEKARKALLAMVFETHPNLDARDLETYLALRGLEASEEVDPERIRELAVALFLLGRKHPLTFDSVIRIAYTVFDEDGDGELDQEEFQGLMKATLKTHLTLDFILRLPAGKEAFLRHLKEEHGEENFYFWQSAAQFVSSLPTVAKARTLYDGYIREGAPKQVNICANTNERIRQKWQAVQNGEAPITRKIFSEAQAEVFNLMERDSFERFRQNPKRMEGFVDSMFKELDRSNNGTISLDEYMEWATNNREVMRFMKGTGGKVAAIRTISATNGQTKGIGGLPYSISSPGRKARDLCSAAIAGAQPVTSSKVTIAQDAESLAASSTTSSTSSIDHQSQPSTPRGGDGASAPGACAARGRGTSVGGSSPPSRRARDGTFLATATDKESNLYVPSTTSASTAPRENKNSNVKAATHKSWGSGWSCGRRRIGRIASSDKDGDDEDLNEDYQESAEGRVSGTIDGRVHRGVENIERNMVAKGGITAGWNTTNAVDAKRRIRAILTFPVCSRILLRGTKGVSQNCRASAQPPKENAAVSRGNVTCDGASGLIRRAPRLHLGLLGTLILRLVRRKDPHQ